MPNENEIQKLTTFFQQLIHQSGQTRIETLFDYTITDFNPEEKTAAFEYKLTEFMLNSFDCLHGGIGATIADCSMGLLICYFLNGQFPPTISLTTNYILPIAKDDIAVVKVKIERLGRHIGSGSAKIYRKSDNLCAITATANFMCSAK